MNEKVGNLSFDLPKPEQMTLRKPYSETTAHLIDSEVKILITQAYDHTMELVKKHKSDIEKVIMIFNSKLDWAFKYRLVSLHFFFFLMSWLVYNSIIIHSDCSAFL